MSKLEVVFVDKFREAWSPEILYNGFVIRALLKENYSLIKAITLVGEIRTKLVEQYGYNNDQWLLVVNPYTNNYELYLRNAGTLVLWKLQDHKHFDTLFSKVEQHKDNLNLDEV